MHFHLIANICLFLSTVNVVSSANVPNPQKVLILDTISFLSDEMIESINQLNTTWKAGRNFDEKIPIEYLKGLLGVIPASDEIKLPVLLHEIDPEDELPESFDARQKWPNCTTIGKIRDQGSCGSCWAFGAVEAMSDRLCIASNGAINVELSADELISCCNEFGCNGCFGGRPEIAWNYFVDFGLVTGGSYNSHKGCQPYEIKPCDHTGTSNGKLHRCNSTEPTPKCVHKCEKGYNRTYENDKYYGLTSYLLPNDQRQIMKEIMTNGPVEADFVVYEDFFSYKSGVYQHKKGCSISGHAIRILGWGVDDGTPYWLCANSWNPFFGEKGFFKMLRGRNECDIENGMIAGKVKV